MKTKKKKKKLEKTDIIAIIGTVSFLIVGLAAFVIGYGVKDGWEAVGRWFTSRWAIYVYIAIVLLAFVLVWYIHRRRMEK